jgi:hypothetical protein
MMQQFQLVQLAHILYPDVGTLKVVAAILLSSVPLPLVPWIQEAFFILSIQRVAMKVPIQYHLRSLMALTALHTVSF